MSGRSLAGSKQAPPRFVAHFPALVPDDGGGYCIQPRRRSYEERADAVAYDVAQEPRWMVLVRDYARCTRDPVPEGVPAVEAAEFWRVLGEDLLPKPQPWIAPGYMLAGKRGYLETNSAPTAHFEHPTPLGTLVIDATSTVWVDWGDGGLQGPFEGPGEPWPKGTISHYWTDDDRYDVRVEQRWTATWALAGRHGELAGLRTEGRIDDFEVRQLQAVIDR